MTTDHDAEIVENSDHYDVVIVGAGAAGIGVAIALQHSGVENYLIVDRETIGSSFRSWPAWNNPSVFAREFCSPYTYGFDDLPSSLRLILIADIRFWLTHG